MADMSQVQNRMAEQERNVRNHGQDAFPARSKIPLHTCGQTGYSSHDNGDSLINQGVSDTGRIEGLTASDIPPKQDSGAVRPCPVPVLNVLPAELAYFPGFLIVCGEGAFQILGIREAPFPVRSYLPLCFSLGSVRLLGLPPFPLTTAQPMHQPERD